MAECDLWNTIVQTGPPQFCDGVWGGTKAISNAVANISTQPADIGRREENNFPDFTDNHLELRAGNYGRGIYTTAMLNSETQVFKAVAFAAAVERKKRNTSLYCSGCHKTQMRSYITCSTCRVVSYCNVRCKKFHQTHHLVCGTGFEFISNRNIKCAIQMVLEAISAHDDNVQALKDDLEDIFLNPDWKANFAATIPVQVDDQRSRLRCILRLGTGTPNNTTRKHAQLAYSHLVTLPQIAVQAEAIGTKRFLKHLTTYFYYIIIENGFDMPIVAGNYRRPTVTSNLKRVLIFDTISFANHSCVPNVRLKLIDNMLVGITNVRILANHELMISYIPTIYHKNRSFHFTNTAARQKIFRKQWGFTCQCTLCTFPNGTVNFRNLQQLWPSNDLNAMMSKLKRANFNLNQNIDNCLLLLWFIYWKTWT